MKGIVCILLCLFMTLTLIACDLVENGEVSESDTAHTAENDAAEAKTDKSTNKSTSSQSKPKQTNKNTSSSTTKNDNAATPESLKDINNGILKQAYAETLDVPENMKYLGTANATEENNGKTIKATVALYVLDGDVVNWTTENDLIYVITKGNNRLVIIDSTTMLPIYNTPLSGTPAEMNIIGDKIYISLPDLCKIDIFSKADAKKETSIIFDHEVSSFCIEGDYIYYSEHDQHCSVFKKNLVTNETLELKKENNGYISFYFPKILLNTEDRILYIGETNSSGCKIYYYDADTLEMIGVFAKDNYGMQNHTREMFHIGDTIYWSSYALSDTTPKDLIGKYGISSTGSMVYASEELISTHEGLFLTETYECIIDYQEAKFDFKSLIVTDSYNLFFRNTILDQNMIIGINFDLQ